MGPAICFRGGWGQLRAGFDQLGRLRPNSAWCRDCGGVGRIARVLPKNGGVGRSNFGPGSTNLRSGLGPVSTKRGAAFDPEFGWVLPNFGLAEFGWVPTELGPAWAMPSTKRVGGLGFPGLGCLRDVANEALAQQNQLLKLQLDKMQQSLAVAQRQAQEVQARRRAWRRRGRPGQRTSSHTRVSGKLPFLILRISLVS